MTAAAGELLAHGVGGREDLPIPFSFALTGAALALIVSFVALGVLWREPKLGGPRAGAAVPPGVQQLVDASGVRWALRLLGMAITTYVVVAAVLGPDLAINPTAGSVYVLLWVGLVPASILLGPVWRLLNPLRTLHLLLTRVTRVDPQEGMRPYPVWLGYWPAALSLFTFVWLELVAPDRATLPVLRGYFLAYAGVHLLAAVWFGQGWFRRGDGFEVYSTVLSRLGVFGRRRAGRSLVSAPLDNLATLRPQPGLAAVVVVLLGSTAYDGLSNAPVWFRFVQRSSLSPTLLGTLGLVGMVCLVGAAYALAVTLTGRLGATGSMSAQFAPSLVPIAVGYLIAHYYSLFVLEGQRTLAQLSDPLSNGANVFGTAEMAVRSEWVTPSGVATIQVAAVVTGHVLGVVLAHDRAVGLLPRRRAVVGQLPLLVLMVAYTLGGLALLFAA